MSSSHQVRFDVNGVTADAEFIYFNRSGRLNVWLDGKQVVELEWVDYQPAFETDAGLEKFARSELANASSFSRDPSNYGEGESPNAAVLALFDRAAV